MLTNYNDIVNRYYNLNWNRSKISMGFVNTKCKSEILYSACIKGCAGKRVRFKELVKAIGDPDYVIGTDAKKFAFYYVYFHNVIGKKYMMMLDVNNGIIVGGGTNTYENFRKSAILIKRPVR